MNLKSELMEPVLFPAHSHGAILVFFIGGS